MVRSAVLQRDFIVLGRHTQTNILLSPLAFVAPNLVLKGIQGRLSRLKLEVGR